MYRAGSVRLRERSGRLYAGHAIAAAKETESSSQHKPDWMMHVS